MAKRRKDGYLSLSELRNSGLWAITRWILGSLFLCAGVGYGVKIYIYDRAAYLWEPYVHVAVLPVAAGLILAIAWLPEVRDFIGNLVTSILKLRIGVSSNNNDGGNT